MHYIYYNRCFVVETIHLIFMLDVCNRYRRWQANHPAKCTKTHDGSSGSMESKIACDIFGRSIDRYKLRYTRYIGDGDTNSFKTVAQSRPYGDTQIVKIECVGHVQKRMGTRLRNLKNSMKGRRLSDGKTIGGKGRLTDDQMGKFQQYYGNAIRENKGNIKRMREAVWAVYFHKRSCDENPIHNFCNISWCPYLKAQAANQPYSHKNNLPVPIMDIVKPIFKDLANTDLLRKCLDGYTQNANESVNSVIWKYCSKTRFHGLTVVQTAVAIAVCLFNDGASTVKTMLEKMGITVFTFTRQFLEDKDALRIICAQRQARMSSKEYRRAQRLRRLGREEELAQLEGFPYQAGGY